MKKRTLFSMLLVLGLGMQAVVADPEKPVEVNMSQELLVQVIEPVVKQPINESVIALLDFTIRFARFVDHLCDELLNEQDVKKVEIREVIFHIRYYDWMISQRNIMDKLTPKIILLPEDILDEIEEAWDIIDDYKNSISDNDGLLRLQKKFTEWQNETFDTLQKYYNITEVDFATIEKNVLEVMKKELA